MTIFKYLLILLLFTFTFFNKSLAQTTRADSLLRSIENLNDDSTKVSQYVKLGYELLNSDINRAFDYIEEAILLGKKINYKKGLADALKAKGIAVAQRDSFEEASLPFQEALNIYREIGDKTGEANMLSNLGSIYFILGFSAKALELHFESLKISEQIDDKLRIGTSLNNIGTVYSRDKNTINESFTFFKKSLDVFQEINEESYVAIAAMNIGEVYFIESNYDSAIYFHEMSLELCDGTLDATFPLTQLGEINAELGNFEKAYDFHKRALEISEELDAKYEMTQSLIGLAKTQKIQGEYEGSIGSLEKAKAMAIETDAKNELLDVYQNLAEIQAHLGQYKAAYENEINAKSVKELIDTKYIGLGILYLQFEFELDKKEAEIDLLQKDTELKDAAVFNQRIIIFASLAVLIMFIIIIVYLYQNNLSKQKANRLLQTQKEEIRTQRENVESAYDKLKSTQAQLIQSEKMASLGELTAGIAHEILNPLNFVNNFSEVSTELVDEMNQELEKGDIQEAKVIGRDLKENLTKITIHGKRADSIVKGMLEHSRSSKGEKIPTDLNVLADEFVRLSYHGLRAKDQAFNTKFRLELDPKLPKVNVVASEIGRVILNLVNNAFYAAGEKAKSGTDGHIDEGFQPEVIISTKKTSKAVVLTVKDNGNGIPDSIKEKIFQPFFTTKPTGSGTGLGLSLSYDILKAHGGELKVESSKGKGSEFSIHFPLV